jgi:hypothetical protein
VQAGFHKTHKSLKEFMSQIVPQTPSMTSREIADLVEKRHDNVLRTIETLGAAGVITLPQFEEVSNPGPGPKTIMQCRVGKRDSYIIVAQLSPEFTARLVDRWQELESTAAAPAPAARVAASKPPVLVAAGMAPTLVRALRAFGIEKNAAAIGANQIINKETGVNLLQLAGHTHLVTPSQEICFTPTELGNRRCVKAHTMNRALADAGLQERIGKHWVPTEKGRPHAVVTDTGKAHGDGAPVQQVKWRDSVLAEIAL